MFIRPRHAILTGLLIAALGLSGCEDAEEKAERFYQSGLTLLAAGDEERALVELRNVFKHNGFHKEARQLYADTQLRRGAVGEATGQYLRLIEQYPDTLDVRVQLAELALARSDWAEVERHGRAAIALDATPPAVQALRIALDYRDAVLARNTAGRAKAAEDARTLLEGAPENPVARRVLIDQLMTAGDTVAALPQIDAALANDQNQLDFQMLKLRILAEAEDVEGTGAQLKRMFALFPDHEQIKTSLISWYLVQRDIDGAEAFMRQLAGDVTGPPTGHAAVVQLLQATRGPEAARAELDALIAANAGTENVAFYGALRAAMDFEAGQTDAAIAAMEAIVKETPASDQTRRIKSMLAQMLDSTGNRVGARALVEEVLAEDASNVEALKLRAGWRIAEDRPGDAILDLRSALNQSPRDPSILTLMAVAHERDGNLDLAGERLALAVEASGSGPAESLRYAQFLQRQGRGQVVETVLSDALRANPNNPAVLTALAELYLRQSKWTAAQGMVDRLAGLGLPQTAATVQALQAAVLQGQNRSDESLAFLNSQIKAGTAGNAPVTMLVQAHINAGKLDEARTALDEALQAQPQDRQLRLLSAGLHTLAGNVPEAEAGYRAIIAETPADDVAVRMLFVLLSAEGRSDEATAVLDAGLAATPGAQTLLWIKAGILERAGAVDEAIAIYEGLYAENTGNVIVANNLASLITSHRRDPESLERAFTIARRLRGSDVPAFQDTYGWIEFRRGNLREALAALEPAAAGLPEDPQAQFHLGMTYAALGEPAKAIRQLERALELAGDQDLPFVDEARSRMAELQAPPAAKTP